MQVSISINFGTYQTHTEWWLVARELLLTAPTTLQYILCTVDSIEVTSHQANDILSWCDKIPGWDKDGKLCLTFKVVEDAEEYLISQNKTTPVYGLVAKGPHKFFDRQCAIYSKNIFLTEQRAHAEISTFTKECLTVDNVNDLTALNYVQSCTIVEYELLEEEE